jgi:uncharacterized protein YggE
MRHFILVLLLLSSPLLWAESDERSITVIAEGYVEAVPDTLSFSISVKRTAEDTKTARAATDRIVKEVLEQSRSLGIAKDDIDSSAMQAFPEYEWRKQKRHYLGESVVRTVAFTLRDLELYPALVQKLSNLSIEQMGRAQLSHSNIEQLRLDALKVAIARGKTRAATIAAEIDAKLDKVILVTEAFGNEIRPQARMMMAEAAAADASSEGGYSYAKQRISARVEMRFSMR